MLSLLAWLYFFLPFQWALAPMTGFDVAIIRPVILGLTIWWLFSGLIRRRLTFAWHPVTFLWLSLLFFMFLSLLVAREPLWSLRKILFLFSFVPLFFVLTDTLSNSLRSSLRVFSLFTLGACASALLALLQFILQWFVGLDTLLTFWQKSLLPFFLGPAFGSTVGQYSSLLVNVHGLTLLRATALFPDPHIAAYYFGMTLPLALALAASHPHQRRLWYSAASLLFIADILTFSRGGALGLLCGGLFWGYARLPRLTPKHLRALIFTFLFLLGLILSPIGSRFLSSFSLTEGSNQGRLAMWQAASTLILTHPWLGVGLGNFPLAVLPSASYRLPIYAHSLPLDIMAESGLGAGLCYFLLLFFTLRSLLRLAHHNAFFFGPATSLIIFTVHSFFENPLYSVHILPLLILCLAVSTFSPAKISSHA